MKNLNMKRSKRLTGMVCMMLSIFLLTMALQTFYPMWMPTTP